MTKNLAEFEVDERVIHETFGLGKIVRVDDRHTVIEFDESGRKKFVSSMLKLEHSDAPAPVKTRSRARKPKAPK